MWDFFNGNSKKSPTAYIKYKLCEKFGWTEQELLSQSSEFVNEMLEVMNIESIFNTKKNG